MLKFGIFVLGCLLLEAACFTVNFTTPTPSPSLRVELDKPNLDALNRELRNALVEKASQEIAQAQKFIDNLRPQITECDTKVQRALDACVDCVEIECQRRFQNCSSVTIRSYSADDTSVSTSDINGRGYMNICSYPAGVTETCQTVLYPTGFSIVSINRMNGNLEIQLQRPLGLLSGIFSGSNLYPGLFTGSASTRRMTPEERSGFQRSMREMRANLRSARDNMRSSMRNMRQNTQQAVDNVQRNRQDMNNWGRSFGQNMRNWGLNFARSMMNMFSPGRFKRQAPQLPPQYDHCNALLTDFIDACGQQSSRCRSCQARDINDLMRRECGALLVNQIEASETSLEQLDQILYEFSSVHDVLTKIEYDNVLLDPVNIGYGGVMLFANIRGTPEKIYFTENIELRNLSGTAAKVANSIWTKWAANIAKMP